MRFAAILLAALAVFALSQSALAQQIKPLDVERDPNGVDLLQGKVDSPMPTLSIPAAPELTFKKLIDFWPVLEGKVPSGGQTENTSYSVNAGGIASDSFQCAEACTARNGQGSTIFGGYTEGPFYYTQGGSGKRITFDIRYGLQSPPAGGDTFNYVASSVYIPGEATLWFSYETRNPFPTVPNYVAYRPSVVTSSSGYQLNLTYQSDDPVNGGGGWSTLLKAEIVKSSAPAVPLASLTYGGTNPNFTITDLAGRVYQCSCNNTLIGPEPGFGGSLKLPGETTNTFEASKTDTATGHVLQVASDGVAYSYAVVDDGPYFDAVNNITITAPNGFYRYVEVTNFNTSSPTSASPPRRRIDSVRDSQNRTTSYTYDSQQRVKQVTYPEGNAVQITFDMGGNITEMRTKPKPGSGQADIVQYANYNWYFECDLLACFRPNWTKDGNGNQTDYTWDSAGQLVTQLDPVDAQSKRRKVKNTWSGKQLIREEICEANASGTELTCGTANSFVREMTYFGGTSLPLSQTITDGVGNAPLTTTYSYDNAGRLLSTDGPLPGTDDASYAIYDVLGRKLWEIGPKGENGLRPATRTTYRVADDKLLQIQTGTVTDALGSSFALISQVDTEYNARRLATKSSVSDGSSTYAVGQMSYDARNREDCSAVRMNPATWASLPASACTLGTAGTDGPDRISRKHYDTESRVIRIEQGVGTTLRRDYATYSFTPNGQTASMTDARGYKATMLYDGFDRQTHWYFPMPSQTGQENPGDYEQYSYDANGNRLTLRKRDGSVLSYTYDKLNRVTKKTVPERAGLDATHTRDVFYMYDIRGLQLRATYDTAAGDGLYTTYDRYGRVTINRDRKDGTDYYLRYGYNVDSSRSWIKYPDLVQFNYSYSSGGQFNQIKDAANTVLADYNYNPRGELAQIDRAATAPDQAWSYDPIGRLASTGWSNAAAPLNVTWSFTRNPANQIASETQSNDAYSWTGHNGAANDVTRPYIANGLNQYTSVSGVGYCYDPNGNLTRDDKWAYLYDVENRLVEMRKLVAGACPTTGSGYSGTLAAKLRYDPLGRLHEVQGYNEDTGILVDTHRFLYDGDALVAEYSAAGAMLKRYLHGPAAGADDPLVEYAGAGTAAAGRRNLYADARGSIVLSTDSAGGSGQINSYDEYGVPVQTNTGRFQYTGQIWLPELGMNYYKARMYSPLLGRFMQTDPIGYEDDSNLYGYVGNDPVNGVDPDGKSCKASVAGGRFGMSCTLDDKRSFLKAGWTRAQIRTAERNLTRTVNKLAGSDKKVTVSVGGRSFVARGRDVARGLSQAYVTYGGKRSGTFATMEGGKLSPWGRTVGSGAMARPIRQPDHGFPFQLRLYDDFRYRTDSQQMDSLAHEGLHTLPGEANFVGLKDFNRTHGDEYRKKASELLDD